VRRARIVGEDMQKRCLAARQDILHLRIDEKKSMAWRRQIRTAQIRCRALPELTLSGKTKAVKQTNRETAMMENSFASSVTLR
jgi:hypothetical protein